MTSFRDHAADISWQLTDEQWIFVRPELDYARDYIAKHTPMTFSIEGLTTKKKVITNYYELLTGFKAHRPELKGRDLHGAFIKYIESQALAIVESITRSLGKDKEGKPIVDKPQVMWANLISREGFLFWLFDPDNAVRMPCNKAAHPVHKKRQTIEAINVLISLCKEPDNKSESQNPESQPKPLDPEIRKKLGIDFLITMNDLYELDLEEEEAKVKPELKSARVTTSAMTRASTASAATGTQASIARPVVRSVPPVRTGDQASIARNLK